jgi:hypothetical protein
VLQCTPALMLHQPLSVQRRRGSVHTRTHTRAFFVQSHSFSVYPSMLSLCPHCQRHVARSGTSADQVHKQYTASAHANDWPHCDSCTHLGQSHQAAHRQGHFCILIPVLAFVLYKALQCVVLQPCLTSCFPGTLHALLCRTETRNTHMDAHSTCHSHMSRPNPALEGSLPCLPEPATTCMTSCSSDTLHALPCRTETLNTHMDAHSTCRTHTSRPNLIHSSPRLCMVHCLSPPPCSPSRQAHATRFLATQKHTTHTWMCYVPYAQLPSS